MTKSRIEEFAKCHAENKRYLAGDEWIYPAQVLPNIFFSKELFHKIKLPDGRNPIEFMERVLTEDQLETLLNYFRARRIEGASVVTGRFLKSPPRDKEEFEQSRKPTKFKKGVFIVHGRDRIHALELQKYLTGKMGINAELFEDFQDESRTIIEQLEYIKSNVGYAFIVATPDDFGCLMGPMHKLALMVIGSKKIDKKTVDGIFEMLHTRARQNVVFEFGLFIGALGRDRVCCLLKKGTEERPSDIDGIIYKPFDKSVKEVFHELPEKMEKAGLINP